MVPKMTPSKSLIKPGETRAVTLADDTDWQAQQDIPEEKANETFKELGLERITLRRVKGWKKVAEILKKIGMVEYERGRLMHREMHMDIAREALTDICAKEGPADTKVAAAHALQLLIQADNKTAELNIRLEELAKTNDSRGKLASELPPPGVNVGVAVTFGMDKKPEGTTVDVESEINEPKT